MGSNWGSGYDDLTQSVRAMYVFRQFHLSLNKIVGTRKYRHIISADVVQNIQCILSGILQRSVSGRSGNTKQKEGRVMSCIYYRKGVI